MPSRELSAANPVIVAIFQAVKGVFEKMFPAYTLKPTCTYRSPAEQLIEFRAGRSQLDGTKKVGMHNHHPARAIDIGVFRKSDGAYIDDLAARGQFQKDLLTSLYWNIGQLAQRNGARWGGDWDNDGIPVQPDPDESLWDPYHIEMK
jgi:hypothetical protein